MNFRNKRLSLSEAKEIDMVNYLSSLGYEPSKIRSNDFWYLSPLRDENVASFKVNRKLNRWYDHGIGEGGNIIDFAVRYHHCTIGELLKILDKNLSFHKPAFRPSKIGAKPEKKIRILEDFSLNSPALLHYLNQRRIPIDIAVQYCREVRYELDGKFYYGIGFKNDLRGFEIRNPYFKASSSPKGITTIDNSTDKAIVFEGFIDFLSFKTIHQNEAENKFDFVILNSVSFFEKARPFMEKHQSVMLYLDRDRTGQNCSRPCTFIKQKI